MNADTGGTTTKGMLSAGLSETETKMRRNRRRIITLGSMGRNLDQRKCWEHTLITG